MKLPAIVKHIPPTDLLGLCDRDDRILYINMRQCDKQVLITTLHEALHYIHPEYTEEKVEEDSVFLGKIAWKMGFRLHHRKKNAKAISTTRKRPSNKK